MYISSNFNIGTNLQILLTGESGKTKGITSIVFSTNTTATMKLKFFINDIPFYTHKIVGENSVLDLSNCPLIITSGQTLSAQYVEPFYSYINVRIFGVTKEISE